MVMLQVRAEMAFPTQIIDDGNSMVWKLFRFNVEGDWAPVQSQVSS